MSSNAQPPLPTSSTSSQSSIAQEINHNNNGLMAEFKPFIDSDDIHFRAHPFEIVLDVIAQYFPNQNSIYREFRNILREYWEKCKLSPILGFHEETHQKLLDLFADNGKIIGYLQYLPPHYLYDDDSNQSDCEKIEDMEVKLFDDPRANNDLNSMIRILRSILKGFVKNRKISNQVLLAKYRVGLPVVDYGQYVTSIEGSIDTSFEAKIVRKVKRQYKTGQPTILQEFRNYLQIYYWAHYNVVNPSADSSAITAYVTIVSFFDYLKNEKLKIKCMNEPFYYQRNYHEATEVDFFCGLNLTGKFGDDDESDNRELTKVLTTIMRGAAKYDRENGRMLFMGEPAVSLSYFDEICPFPWFETIKKRISKIEVVGHSTIQIVEPSTVSTSTNPTTSAGNYPLSEVEGINQQTTDPPLPSNSSVVSTLSTLATSTINNSLSNPSFEKQLFLANIICDDSFDYEKLLLDEIYGNYQRQQINTTILESREHLVLDYWCTIPAIMIVHELHWDNLLSNSEKYSLEQNSDNYQYFFNALKGLFWFDEDENVETTSSLNDQSNNRSLADKCRVFYCGKKWYTLIRLFVQLCKQLRKFMKRLATNQTEIKFENFLVLFEKWTKNMEKEMPYKDIERGKFVKQIKDWLKRDVSCSGDQYGIISFLIEKFNETMESMLKDAFNTAQACLFRTIYDNKPSEHVLSKEMEQFYECNAVKLSRDYENGKKVLFRVAVQKDQATKFALKLIENEDDTEAIRLYLMGFVCKVKVQYKYREDEVYRKFLSILHDFCVYSTNECYASKYIHQNAFYNLRRLFKHDKTLENGIKLALLYHRDNEKVANQEYDVKVDVLEATLFEDDDLTKLARIFKDIVKGFWDNLPDVPEDDDEYKEETPMASEIEIPLTDFVKPDYKLESSASLRKEFIDWIYTRAYDKQFAQFGRQLNAEPYTFPNLCINTANYSIEKPQEGERPKKEGEEAMKKNKFDIARGLILHRTKHSCSDTSVQHCRAILAFLRRVLVTKHFKVGNVIFYCDEPFFYIVACLVSLCESLQIYFKSLKIASDNDPNTPNSEEFLRLFRQWSEGRLTDGQFKEQIKSWFERTREYDYTLHLSMYDDISSFIETMTEIQTDKHSSLMAAFNEYVEEGVFADKEKYLEKVKQICPGRNDIFCVKVYATEDKLKFKMKDPNFIEESEEDEEEENEEVNEELVPENPGEPTAEPSKRMIEAEPEEIQPISAHKKPRN